MSHNLWYNYRGQVTDGAFWFQITEDHLLDIALPPAGWHNPGWPELPWRMEQIDYVMTLR